MLHLNLCYSAEPNFSLLQAFSTSSMCRDTDVSSMSDKDLELYKLYRAERELPPVRGIELLKMPEYNKVIIPLFFIHSIIDHIAQRCRKFL